MSHWSRLFCCAHSSAPFNQMAADPGFCLNKQFAENRSQLHSHRWCGVTCWLFLAFINPSPLQLSPILCALVVRLAFIFCPRPNNVNYCCFDQQRAASFLYFANSLCLTKARTNNYPIYKTWTLWANFPFCMNHELELLHRLITVFVAANNQALQAVMSTIRHGRVRPNKPEISP